jgi:hypothetical protein
LLLIPATGMLDGDCFGHGETFLYLMSLPHSCLCEDFLAKKETRVLASPIFKWNQVKTLCFDSGWEINLLKLVICREMSSKVL